jgi:hypothetical protein
VVITIVDSNHRPRDLLPQLEELVTDALVILDDCTVIQISRNEPEELDGNTPIDAPARLVNPLPVLTKMSTSRAIWS